MAQHAPSSELTARPAAASNIVSAVLTAIHPLPPCEDTGIACGSAHIHVRYRTVRRGVVALDRAAAPMPQPQPQPQPLHRLNEVHKGARVIESTWTFEGVVIPNAGREAARDWRVVSIQPMKALNK